MTRISTQGERLSRRQFLQGGAFVGCAAGFGSSAWSALALSRENEARRRFAPNDGLSLAEYIIREAPKMEVFPFGLIAVPSSRFRATLTFKRYLPFFRYKEKVLASTIEEVDDCVSRIESFSSKEKALVLWAMKIYSWVNRNDLHDGYQSRYRDWQKRVKARLEFPEESFPHNLVSTPSADSVKERSYSPSVRPYFPYYYPSLGFSDYVRSFLILGEPFPDCPLDKARLHSWYSVQDKYRLNGEEAFPAISVDSTDVSNDARYEEIALKLKESPLRFPMGVYFWGSSRNYDPTSLFENDEEHAVGDVFRNERERRFWIKWIENIDECVELVKQELNLIIPPERWVSDFYPEADAFLKKVAEREKDESTPLEKIELLTALREYWLSMQIDYDYDIYDSGLLDSSTGLNPFHDIIGANAVTLGAVARITMGG